MEWTWLSGNRNFAEDGYEAPGYPSLPSSFSFSLCWYWRNTSWIYGGAVETSVQGIFWKYNATSFSLVSYNELGSSPSYGSKGIPSPQVHPGARRSPNTAFAVGTTGIWLFGGGSYSFSST